MEVIECSSCLDDGELDFFLTVGAPSLELYRWVEGREKVMLSGAFLMGFLWFLWVGLGGRQRLLL